MYACYLQADLFLAPQIHAAMTRFQVDMVIYPSSNALFQVCHWILKIKSKEIKDVLINQHF